MAQRQTQVEAALLTLYESVTTQKVPTFAFQTQTPGTNP